MAERKLRAKVHHCGVHKYAPSWLEGIGVCSCVHTVCVTADDGYHEHQIRIGDDAWSRIVISEHLHVWTEGASVGVATPKTSTNVEGTFAEVWRDVVTNDGPLDGVGFPTVKCHLMVEAREQVVHHFQRYSAEQRSTLAASHRTGRQKRNAVGEFFFTHPAVPDRAFPTRKAAASAAVEARVAALRAQDAAR